MADALCDEFPLMAWYLRAQAYIRFGYDPDGSSPAFKTNWVSPRGEDAARASSQARSRDQMSDSAAAVEEVARASLLLSGPMCSAAVAPERVPCQSPAATPSTLTMPRHLPKPVLRPSPSAWHELGVHRNSDDCLRERLVKQDLRQQEPVNVLSWDRSDLGVQTSPRLSRWKDEPQQLQVRRCRYRCDRSLDRGATVVGWAEAAPALKRLEDFVRSVCTDQSSTRRTIQSRC